MQEGGRGGGGRGRGGGGGGSTGHYRRGTSGKPQKYNKDKFLQANFRFLVSGRHGGAAAPAAAAVGHTGMAYIRIRLDIIVS